MTITTTKPQLFSGDLRPFPGIPADWSSTKRQLAEAILADVRAAFPNMLGEVVPGADIEDFWEDACRVSAAWKASSGQLAAKQTLPGDPSWTRDEMRRRLGPVPRHEEGGAHARDLELAHPLVRSYGGRAMLLGMVGGDDSATDIVQWLADRHRHAGVKHGIVKAAERKNGIWSIELDSDPEIVRQRLFDAMDWTYVRLEGAVDALLAQDQLPLEYEYRLFIVDGRVVSGAGCVEEFTPLDRTPGPFDSRMRRHRGHFQEGPSAVEDRPDLTGRLVRFGRQVAAEHGGTVVIDVAFNAATDQPVVIELNGISNSGLYASSPWAVTQALITARDRGYQL